jgi:hypothetical protein
MLAHSLAVVLALTAGTAAVATLAIQPAGKAPATQPAAAPTTPAVVAAKVADPLASVAFLAGRWIEMNAEGNREEHWSAPRAGTMMGMFRWDKPDGTPNMLEILAINSEGDDVVMRLHHLSKTLQIHGECDKPMTFKLSEKGERRAVFTPTANAEMLSKVVYHCPEPDRLKISVVMATEAGAPPESLEFDLKREGK